jgi:hypothetical protein
MAKKKELPLELPADTRYPYTHACDLIRMIAGYGKEGTKLSRSDASRIRNLFATITGINDDELAAKLADHYLANREGLESEALREILPFLTEKG